MTANLGRRPMDDSDLLTRFSARLEDRRKPEPSPEGEADEIIVAGDIYATTAGPRAALVLEFIRQNGNAFALPYHGLSAYWWHPPALLLLEYGGMFTVALRGKRLAELYRRIKDQRVTWIRECSEPEADTLPLAVTAIEILQVFPSRETMNGGFSGDD